MSAQRVTSSVEAKPCLANAALSVRWRTSANGRGKDLPGLFTLQGSATSIGHDASSWDCATKACRTMPRWARGRSVGLVRPPPPRAALGRSAWRGPRPLSGLALRDHAAADHHEGGRAVFCALYRALVERACARGGAARGRAQDVGRARLLRARAASARLREG